MSAIPAMYAIVSASVGVTFPANTATIPRTTRAASVIVANLFVFIFGSFSPPLNNFGKPADRFLYFIFLLCLYQGFTTYTTALTRSNASAMGSCGIIIFTARSNTPATAAAMRKVNFVFCVVVISDSFYTFKYFIFYYQAISGSLSAINFLCQLNITTQNVICQEKF